MITYAIVFILGLNFSNGTVDEALVEFGGAPHYYYTIEECNQSIADYGIENIINEFMGEIQASEDLIAYPKSMPFCAIYDINTGSYPEYPQFEMPENKPRERILYDELGREISRSG